MTDPVTADETTQVQPRIGPHVEQPAGYPQAGQLAGYPQAEQPAAAAPVAQSPVPGHLAIEPVTCPECGTTATATLNRREARDFCRTCDFPLFWTPTAVLRDPAGRAVDDSLRRLPGTVGRATVASQPCPHCAEPNALSAQLCVRCGRSMHIEAPPPIPRPVYVAPPPPPVYEEPKKRIAWWVWALLATGIVAAVVLIVLVANGTLG